MHQEKEELINKNDETVDQIIIHYPSKDGNSDKQLILNLHPTEDLSAKARISYPCIIDVDWEKYAIDDKSKEILYDIIQKINYTVQDINDDYYNTKEITTKDIMYRISLVCWLQQSLELLEKKIDSTTLNGFSFAHEDKLKKVKKYLLALRSFAVAHPLQTTRHADFSLDGSKICVDIRTRKMVELIFGVGKIIAKRFSFDGIIESDDVQNGDYYLYIYTSEDDYHLGEFIACYFDDLYETAQLYLDKFCSIEQYLCNGE